MSDTVRPTGGSSLGQLSGPGLQLDSGATAPAAKDLTSSLLVQQLEQHAEHTLGEHAAAAKQAFALFEQAKTATTSPSNPVAADMASRVTNTALATPDTTAPTKQLDSANLATQPSAAIKLAERAETLVAPVMTAATAKAQTTPAIQAATAILRIADHPLSGLSVMDFATPTAPFIPPVADAADAVAAGIRLSQHQRLLHFYSPLAGERQLVLASIEGQSAISAPFHYDLELLATDAAIDLRDLMARNVTVGVVKGDGQEHPINGYVQAFGYQHSDGGHAVYAAELVPWFQLLTGRVNSRIYQDLSVRNILDTLFQENYKGIADYRFALCDSYPAERYVVQYAESDFDFASRLMEQHGLFYYFEHRADGHTMVIADTSTVPAGCPPQPDHPQVHFNAGNRTKFADSVTALSSRRRLQPTRVALNTFDFMQPHAPQYVEGKTVVQQGGVPDLEVYDGNPAYLYGDADAGAREARLRMECLDWQTKVFEGASECRALLPGHTMALLDHHWFSDDGQDNVLLIVSVQLKARNNFGQDGAAEGGVYDNRFTAIRSKIPYRPERSHAKPTMKGPQTATVVGPKGQEIHTDKHGRIKVQFHWDRYGRNDERSSCWIRVSQPWAGQGWGSVAIPRIAQEVVVDFVEGDPDRPLCVGRLYNGDQTAPFGMPEAAHMMGFHSRSTPGGGGHCEIVIHDQKGSELVNIHSQKDMATTVQHNKGTTVNGPQYTVNVTQGRYGLTANQQVALSSGTEDVTVHAQKFIDLSAADQHISATAKQHIQLLAQDEHISAQAKKYIQLASQDEHASVTAKQQVTLHSLENAIGLHAKQAIQLVSDTDQIGLGAKTSIVLQAENDITLKVGASSITMTKDGLIVISGKTVALLGTDSVDLNPPTS